MVRNVGGSPSMIREGGDTPFSNLPNPHSGGKARRVKQKVKPQKKRRIRKINQTMGDKGIA